MNKILTFLFFIFSIFNLSAADYYWVGGSGDWSDINHWATTSGGSVNQLQTPTPSDNVYFDANSFSSDGEVVTLNAYQISVNNFDVNQADSVVFDKDICQNFKIYGSLSFQERMSFPANIPFYFSALQTGNTIDAPYHEFSSIHFEGNGGSWTLQDDLTANSTIFLEKGELNTNGFSVQAFDIQSNNNYNRTLTLGSSSVYLYTLYFQGQNININPGTSELVFEQGIKEEIEIINTPNLHFHNVKFKKDSAVLITTNNNIHFHEVEFYDAAYIIGDNTFYNLVLRAGKMLHLGAGDTQTIENQLLPNSNCVDLTTIKADTGTAIIEKNSGNIDVYYVRLRNVHAQGGASFTAYSSIDMGNNNGWNFQPTASRTLYWVDGNGIWNDTTNWSVSSGGPSGECPPTYVDNVIFDANSGSLDTFLITSSDYPPECHDISWFKNNSAPNTLFSYAKKIKIHGSLYFDDGVNFVNRSSLYFVSDDQGETVQTGNVELAIDQKRVYFQGDGSWTIEDSLLLPDSRLILNRGHLNTDNEYVSCAVFSSTSLNPKTLTLGSSEVDVFYGTYDSEDTNWVVVQDSLTLNAGTSQINFYDTLALMINNGLPSVSYHNVNFMYPDGKTLIQNRQTSYNAIHFFGNAFMKGEAFMDSLLLSQDRIYEFEQNTTQTIYDHLDVPAGCLGWVTLKSDDELTPAEFSSPSGTISVQNVNMKNLQATGGASFYAYQSKDQGGNSGWTFTSPTGVDHYWVGGSGNWSDTTHWSYSSGGPGGACLPTPFDNVYFDVNSFNGAGNSVNIDCYNAFSKDMDWSGASGTPVLSGDTSRHLAVFGSLTFINTMQMNYNGFTYFSSTDTGNTITSAGHTFLNVVSFDGKQGSWKLMDTLFVDSSLYHHAGHLDLNHLGMDLYNFKSIYSIPKSLDFDSSYVTIQEKKHDAWTMRVDSLMSFQINQSRIEFIKEKSGLLNEGTGSVTYDQVVFKEAENVLTTGDVVNAHFHKVTFEIGKYIWGSNSYDTLVFHPGDYIIERLDTQTIVDDWQFVNDCNSYINIKSELAGSPAKILKVNGNASGSYLILKDIHGLGNATYDAFESYDKGNTNGWSFHPLTPLQLYWVNGEGYWDDPAHWSFSSGGPGGACIPRKIDDVYFDSLSFISDTSKTVMPPVSQGFMPPVCHNMDWSGAKYKPVLNGSYHIYGSLTMIDSMNNKAALMFLSDTSETIEMAGQSAASIGFFNGGTWDLLDDMRANHGISLFHGRLNSNSHTITAKEFMSEVDSVRTLNLDSSDVYLSEKYFLHGYNLTLDAGNSSIYLIDTSSNVPLNMKLQGGNPQKYHHVTFVHSLASSYLNVKNTEAHFDKLTFDSDANIYGKTFSDSLIFFPGHTYKLDHTKTQTIYDHWQVRGNNCFPINLESTLKDVQADVYKDGSNVQGDFINMRDIKAKGNATFYAGYFSDDISNNDNWIFNNGPSYVYGLPDTSYFQLGGSTTLKTDNFNGGPNTQYLWSTGSTKDSIVVDSSGWYYVTVTYAGNCVVEDSTYLSCMLDIDFITKMTTCNGGFDGYAEIIIPDSSATYDFQWETGDTTQYVDKQPAGWLSVDVLANELCAVYDSVEITEPPPVEMPLGDTAYCEDDSLLLDVGSQFLEFNWSDGYQQQTRLVWDQDTFVLAVMDVDSCWSAPDTFIVYEDTIPYFDLGPDTTLCLYETQTLKALAGCDAYLWSNGSTFPEITVDKVGTYSVQVWQGTCSYADSITLSHCTPELIIPNVFTPNGDGFNDRFIPESTNIYDFEMIIINRWGKEVFRTRDIQQGWDGKINGVAASDGTYYYVIRYKNYGGNKHKVHQSKSGIVTLLR